MSQTVSQCHLEGSFHSEWTTRQSDMGVAVSSSSTRWPRLFIGGSRFDALHSNELIKRGERLPNQQRIIKHRVVRSRGDIPLGRVASAIRIIARHQIDARPIVQFNLNVFRLFFKRHLLRRHI